MGQAISHHLKFQVLINDEKRCSTNSLEIETKDFLCFIDT